MANFKYSVLLLYPDYMNNSGHETYYDLLKANTPENAIEQAQRNAAQANGMDNEQYEDFAALLVIRGHHKSIALFNK